MVRKINVYCGFLESHYACENFVGLQQVPDQVIAHTGQYINDELCLFISNKDVEKPEP